MVRQLACTFVLIGFAAFSGGCLVVKGSSVDETGTKISQPTLSQIEPGKTTETWLLAAAGEPSSRRTVDEHTSILRYDHTVTTSEGATVFLIFAGGDEKKDKTATLFEVTDGVIRRYWTEE